jgi:hypothetical protein
LRPRLDHAGARVHRIFASTWFTATVDVRLLSRLLTTPAGATLALAVAPLIRLSVNLLTHA